MLSLDYSAHLPQEIITNIVYCSEDFHILACVSKPFKHLAEQLTEQIPLEGFFGVDNWRKYGVDVGESSPVPLKLYRQFVEGKGAFLLTFIPEKINGKSLTAKSIDEWLCSYKAQKQSNYKLPLSSVMTDEMIEEYKSKKSHWVLLARDVDPETRSKRFTEQKKIIENEGYAVPCLIDVVVSVFMYNLETSKFVFPIGRQQWTNTRVEEKSKFKNQISIGNYSSAGLTACGCHDYASRNFGVVRTRQS